MSTGVRNDHVTEMGYSVRLREERDGYHIVVGGREILTKSGKPFVYKGLQKALGRFHREVASVEGVEARLKNAGLFHPIRMCAGGCGLEMRMTDRRFPDGHVDTVQDQLDRGERVWCVGCRRL